ncbi:MAG: UDP-N-acetylmuramoyl-tripeptide--D-alanyl-D-alanine ligase [Melioribacteraceae bacterium]|nr:UDP-N-acetylmuramoyl-tripeptide--D-alanyl-D-alanine ligase [Melioribacteraceae bacterium]
MRKIKITLEDLFELPTAVIYNPDDYKAVSGVSIDSRNIKKNDLFIAIKGDKFDGHKFVADAVKNGAAAVMINKNRLRTLKNTEIPIIAVSDTTKAFGNLANIYRRKLDVKVISITGSNGKTSTKEILETLLSEKYKVSKTISNNNNHIGVPLTIFNTKPDCEILILEHGTNHFGEIKYTAEIAQPDYAVITNIGDSHLEFLIDKNGVLKEKKDLLDIANNNGGKVLINCDDPMLKGLSKLYEDSITFGFKGNVETKGKLAGYTKEAFPKTVIKIGKTEIETTIPLLGKANAENYLTAVTIAVKLGLTEKQIIEGTKKLVAFDRRLELTKVNSFYVINDSYNSNPASVKNGIDVLKKFKLAKRKILIFGDMFELGSGSKEKHITLCEPIIMAKIDNVLTIGTYSKYLSKQLKADGINARHFAKRENLIKYLLKSDLSESVILVKGSRGMKMEEFVKVLEERN